MKVISCKSFLVRKSHMYANKFAHVCSFLCALNDMKASLRVLKTLLKKRVVKKVPLIQTQSPHPSN